MLGIYMLGSPLITLTEAPVNLPRKKERALLFYLSTAGHRNARDVLADLLWGELPKKQALHSLSNAVYRINSVFSTMVGGKDLPLIVSNREIIYINHAYPVFIDTRAMEKMSGWAKESLMTEVPREELERLAALYRGDFLEGFYLNGMKGFEEWCLYQREHYRNIYLALLNRLLNLERKGNNYSKALEYAKLILYQDELREDAHYMVMDLYWKSGDRASALRQYNTCREILKKELGVEPLAKTRELYENIISNGGQTQEFVPGNVGFRWDEQPVFLMSINESRGKAFFELCEYDRAEFEFNQLRHQAESRGKAELGGKAFYLLGLTKLCNRDFSMAEDYLTRGYEISTKLGDKSTAIACATDLSLMLSMMGRLEEAKKFSREAEKLGRQTNDDLARCNALIDASRRMLLKGMAKGAVAGFKEALLLAQNGGQTFNELLCRFFLGLAYTETADFGEALNMLFLNLERAQRIGNVFIVTRLPNSIGCVYQELGDIDNSLLWNERGVQICRQYPWPEPLGYSLVNLAIDYMLKGGYVRALENFREAEALARQDNKIMWRWEGRMWLGLGEMALRQGDLDGASAYCQHALTYARKTRIRKNMARALLLQGKILHARGKRGEAVYSAQEALAVAQQMDNPLIALDCQNALAVFYGDLGDSHRARSHDEEAKNILESISCCVKDPGLIKNLNQNRSIIVPGAR